MVHNHSTEKEFSAFFFFTGNTLKTKVSESLTWILSVNKVKWGDFWHGEMQTSLSPASSGDQTFPPGLPLVWQIYVVFWLLQTPHSPFLQQQEMFFLSTFPYPHPDKMPGPSSFWTFPLSHATPSPLDVSLLIPLSAPVLPHKRYQQIIAYEPTI